MARVKHEEIDTWLTKGIDLKKRVLMIEDDIDNESVGLVIRGLHLMEELSEDPVTVLINTYGGSVYDGLGLYDVLISSPCHITTVGVGKVMSMGCDILLAGDVKKAHANTTFMWHTMSSENAGKLPDLEGGVKELKRLYDRTLDIYALRTKKSKQFWSRWLKHEDRYGDAALALSLGFIDEIIA